MMGLFNTEKDEQLLTLFSKEEPAMRYKLKELKGKREQWKTERIKAINREADKGERGRNETRE